MPKAGTDTLGTGAADRRWITAARFGAATLLGAYVLTYHSPPGHVAPFYVRPAGLAMAALLAGLSVIQSLPNRRRSQRLALWAVGIDAAVVVGFLWLYSFDPGRYLFALVPFAVVEATLVAGVTTGLLIWAVTTAGYLLTEAVGAIGSGFETNAAGLILRGALGLLLALVVGVLVRELRHERSGRLAEREGQQRRFHDIVWDLDAIVWEADESGRQFHFVSHPAERILGYPVKRWLSEPGFRTAHMHPEDKDRAVELYRRVAEEGRHREFEYRMQTAGDHVIWIKDRVSPVRDGDGKVRQLRGVMLDITRKKRAEEALRTGFRMLFAHNPQPMWAYDRETLQFLAVNDAAVELYGYARDEFLRLRLTDICSPEEVDRLLLDMVRNRGAFERSGEWRHRLKDGTYIDVEINSHTLEFDSRKASLVSAENITERKRAEKQLREAEVRFRTLVEQIPAITYIAELDGQRSTIYMSPQVETLLGSSQVEWRVDPRLWSKLLHPEDRERVLGEAEQARASGEPFVTEYRMITRNGETVWVRDEAIIMDNDSGEPQFWQGVMVDITERKHAEREIAFLAYHDKLTGLPNRAMFQEVLDLSLARAKRQDGSVAVLYIDLDNFKLVNDSLGHAAGDELLREMTSRLREAVRDTDVVSRLGGDEFLVLLSDLDSTPRDEEGEPEPADALFTADHVARRVQDSLRTPFVLEGTEVYVSASIGISLFPLDAQDAGGLLKNADAAMYRSKKERPGGCMIFAEEVRAALPDISFATRLRKAVEGKHWVLHYQPIVDLATAQVIGVEALLRWLDPEVGIVPPGEFIPLAEEMGLIGTIGDWVVEEMCRQHRIWEDQGMRFDVTFNLSARQLWSPDLLDTVLVRLDSAGIETSSVVVEITESAAMTDLERTQPILWDMHRHGLRLAIDDFGTGYSSLSRLKNLPVDVLKIDRFFIRDLPEDEDTASMVRAIIELANGLGMQPLAEGIETQEQWRFLAEEGCPLGQGFYFSRPLPASEITSMFQRDGIPILGRK
jgi:diguanylate cyclase (GGDEF)-like protein/PAS domain S-box-containing protein